MRRIKEKNQGPLRLILTRGNMRSMIDLNISVPVVNWDSKDQSVIGKFPQKDSINLKIQEKKIEAMKIIDRLYEEDLIRNKSVAQIKDLVLKRMYPDSIEEESSGLKFMDHFKKFMDQKTGRTKEIYDATCKRLKEFNAEIDKISFDEITVKWLTDFDKFLDENGSPSRNARNIHLRNIRAVFNDAIDEELITCYPFRRFKIRPETTRKRSLSIERLREIMTSEPVAEWERRYADCFKLIFMLCGINIVDLFNLVKITDGRIEYHRAKTHRFYSIKVEPEALEIINRWKGKNRLLNYADTVSNYRTYYSRLSLYLKGMEISTYWARHSWATVAASLDIPKETIAAALGHGGNSVTDIYIDFDQRKVDEANRRVLDWVLYGKK